MALVESSRTVSFNWCALQKYCICDVSNVLIYGHRLVFLAKLKDGEYPETCVPGSGLYRSLSSYGGQDFDFKLYLKYFEVYSFGTQVLCKAIIDEERSREEVPPGLSLI